MNYRREHLEEHYSMCLHEMRKQNARKQYHYGQALKWKLRYQEEYPEASEEIQKHWEETWYKKFRKALV